MITLPPAEERGNEGNTGSGAADSPGPVTAETRADANGAEVAKTPAAPPVPTQNSVQTTSVPDSRHRAARPLTAPDAMQLSGELSLFDANGEPLHCYDKRPLSGEHHGFDSPELHLCGKGTARLGRRFQTDSGHSPACLSTNGTDQVRALPDSPPGELVYRAHEGVATGNQFTEAERAHLADRLARIGESSIAFFSRLVGDGTWKLIEQAKAQILSEFLGLISSVSVKRIKLRRVQWYIELPVPLQGLDALLYRIELVLAETLGLHKTEVTYERDRRNTGKMRVWTVHVAKRRRFERVYVIAYYKGTFLRIEIAFEHPWTQELGVATDMLGHELARIGRHADAILDRLLDRLDLPPPFLHSPDQLHWILQAYGVRKPKKHTEWIELVNQLSNYGVYDPERAAAVQQEIRRQVFSEKLAKPEEGFLDHNKKLNSEGLPSHLALYNLRSDAIDRASSHLSKQLIGAIRRGVPKTVKSLLQLGADPDKVITTRLDANTLEVTTPFEEAHRLGNEKVIAHLEQAKAKREQWENEVKTSLARLDDVDLQQAIDFHRGGNDPSSDARRFYCHALREQERRDQEALARAQALTTNAKPALAEREKE